MNKFFFFYCFWTAENDLLFYCHQKRVAGKNFIPLGQWVVGEKLITKFHQHSYIHGELNKCHNNKNYGSCEGRFEVKQMAVLKFEHFSWPYFITRKKKS